MQHRIYVTAMSFDYLNKAEHASSIYTLFYSKHLTL